MLAGLGAWICLLDGMVVVAGPMSCLCILVYVFIQYGCILGMCLYVGACMYDHLMYDMCMCAHDLPLSLLL